MLPRIEFEAYVSALEKVAGGARANLAKLWARLDFTKPEAVRDLLLQYIPALTEAYGNAAGTLAQEFYGALRAAAAAPGVYLPLLAVNVPHEAVERAVRYAVGDLFADAPDAALRKLSGDVDKYVKQTARDTIALNVSEDPSKPRYARVPRGAKTCAFCIMLASRGFAYRTAESAGDGVNRYHPYCDCQIVPGWGDNPSVEGYDPDGLYQRYLDCCQTIGSRGSKAVLAEMRTRDVEWLNTGKPAAWGTLSGASPLSKEIATAEILGQHGISSTFIPVRSYINSTTGLRQRIPTPDVIINGREWEYKAIRGSGKNTVNAILGKAQKKSDCVVLDNSQGSGLPDGEVIRQIRETFLDKRRHVKDILIINTNHSLLRVKNRRG
jgi:hypothetical protein